MSLLLEEHAQDDEASRQEALTNWQQSDPAEDTALNVLVVVNGTLRHCDFACFVQTTLTGRLCLLTLRQQVRRPPCKRERLRTSPRRATRCSSPLGSTRVATAAPPLACRY